MQTTVQRPKAIRFWSGILFVSSDKGNSWINLWALKDAEVLFDKTIKEMVYDNAKMPPRVKINEIVFKAKLFEIALDKFQLIDGLADYSTVDGTEKQITNEDLWVWLQVWKPIKLKNRNSNLAEVTGITIKNDGSNLEKWVDYEIFLLDGYTHILPKKLQTGKITADYTFTEIAKKLQNFKDIEKFLALNMFKFSNIDEEGKEFAVVFPQGYNKAGFEAKFEADESEDSMWVGIEIKAFPTESKDLCQIIDEQDVV